LNLATYLDPLGLLAVLGGTAFALTLHFRPRPLVQHLHGALKLLTARPPNADGLRERLIALCEKARRGGPLALEEEALQETDPFLAVGLRLLVEGGRPDELRPLLQAELERWANRDEEPAALLEAAAGYAPAFGMAATLLALIGGRGLAAALLPTLYGTLFGPALLQPLAGGVRQKSTERLQRWAAAAEGLLAIAAGDAPRQLGQRLALLLPGGKAGRDEGADVA
jgi:chemotaxis protein MotA